MNKSLKRLERAKRGATVKKTNFGRCLHKTIFTDPNGVRRMRYYHVTKGWRVTLA